MPVSKDDVVAAYRLILGREPTDREASEWLHLESVAELRGAFLASGEFRDGLPKVVPAFASAAARLPLDCQPISVEWTTSTGSEKKLVQYVTATWTALGKVEPHWSVLSSPDFKSDRIGETAEVFFESGREDAARIAATLARHGLAPEKFPRMVEYGCGVGRVTPFLAGMFGEVAAIDISESHLDLARQVVARKGCRNVTLTLARAPEFGMRAAFDLWFSHIVLQHNPPPVMALVLQRMFQMLAPGGVAIFQVPTHVPGYRFNVAEYLAAPKDGSIEVHCLPQEASSRSPTRPGACRSRCARMTPCRPPGSPTCSSSARSRSDGRPPPVSRAGWQGKQGRCSPFEKGEPGKLYSLRLRAWVRRGAKRRKVLFAWRIQVL